MSTPHSQRNRPSGTTATKLLITAASVTAVFGGWAVLSFQASPSGQESNTQALEASLNLQPIPTVVPRPADLGNTTAATIQSQPGKLPSVRPVSQPVLRSIKALPPRPVTRTSSSR